MDIQNLVREKVIGHIKMGTKGAKGLPQKLAYFNVEEDKATSRDMVDIFKQLYPDNPKKLKIRFTSENPFNFRFKRYVNNKVVCIGNDVHAITIGKDEKGRNAQIEIECNENCEQRACGKCKMVGSLKFVLEGIDAGGVWVLNTSGGYSLSNIATVIVEYKKAGISLKNKTFELVLKPQESMAYGTYYSVELIGDELKPQLVAPTESISAQPVLDTQSENLQLAEGTQNINQEPIEVESKASSTSKQTKSKKDTNETTEVPNNLDVKVEENNTKIQETRAKQAEETKTTEETQSSISNHLEIKGYMPTLIGNKKFDKIVFLDNNKQTVEYVLHPKANQDIINYGVGTIIELESSTMEMNHNILCKYKLVKSINENVEKITENNEELKKAV